ncbi:dethiobiotin synthase [Geotalea sp. SG265]|uniref:dethiobiotin synthase n=1 Tax=Geotalea sp. SG265 TaxID=2922867 RepID=UPI001FAEFAC4|nr:dethiobiotin synthase [Geotalea sp. SG265]
MALNKGIFITGTDTGVGKTIVSAVIARLLSNRGLSVGVMKPVTSGCIQVGSNLISEDAELLKWAVHARESDPDVTPYLLREPLAPSMAAERDKVRIDFSAIKAAYERLAAKYDFVIVEGAGGLMVPLAGGLLTADLINYLGLPLIVVARPNLGTVNHTLLTTFAARQMGIPVRGIIVNNYPAIPDTAEEYAPHLLGSLSGAPLLGVFPRSESLDQHALVQELVTTLEADPATALMLREIGI